MESILLETPEDTRRYGMRLGEACQGGEVFLLSGSLGAGKTCLAQGLALGLGVSAAVAVTSPTFVLHNQYQGRLRLDHMDFYRLAMAEPSPPPGGEAASGGCDGLALPAAPSRWLDNLGLEAWWGAADGVCAVEWPEVLGCWPPAGGLAARIAVMDDGRRCLELEAKDSRHARFLSIR